MFTGKVVAAYVQNLAKDLAREAGPSQKLVALILINLQLVGLIRFTSNIVLDNVWSAEEVLETSRKSGKPFSYSL